MKVNKDLLDLIVAKAKILRSDLEHNKFYDDREIQQQITSIQHDVERLSQEMRNDR